ncbi:Xaa-Pro peptidase family protein [bacterium]|nr:Xaa-Pro peptidase family protein [bacterium]
MGDIQSTGQVGTQEVSLHQQGYEIPATEYRDRIDAVRNYLDENGLDAHVVSSEIALQYLTGVDFYPLERPFFMVIFRDQRPQRLLIPIMEGTHFQGQLQAIGLNNVSVLTYDEYLAEPGHCWQDQMTTLLANTNQIAIEPSLPSNRAQAIKDTVAGNTEAQVTMVDITGQLRMVKSDNEIALIRQASDYAVSGMDKIYAKSYPKMPIIQIFSYGKKVLQDMIKDFHLQGVSPSAIHNSALLASWPDDMSADPHYIPKFTDRIERGAIHMSFIEFAGYYSELETKVEQKNASPEEKYYYDLMMQSREAALSVLGPGVIGSDVDAAAKSVLYDAGLSYEHILHRTGHGLGLEHHEAPFLVAGDHTVLEPGMVVSIEPGIYINGRSEEVSQGVYVPITDDVCLPEDDCPGAGGYRHSHTYLITEDGYEDLTPFTTDWQDVTTYKGGIGPRIMGALIGSALKFKDYEDLTASP